MQNAQHLPSVVAAANDLHRRRETALQVVASLPKRERLLRLPQVEDLTGLKKSTIYALMKQGEFVPSVALTARCVAWPESQVLQWVQNRIAANSTTAQ